MNRSSGKRKIGFYVFRNIHVPHHLREYYASLELKKAGWDVEWLLPSSGDASDDLKVDWPIARYRECDFRGHKFLFPAYFGSFLKKRGIDTLWISGWAQRDPDALMWLVRILKLRDIRIIYDTVDPIELFDAAHSPEGKPDPRCSMKMSKVYDKCDMILAVTPEIGKFLESNGAGKGKIFSCRWGTDLSVFRPGNVTRDFRKEMGIGEDAFLVGWLGSMNPFKGLEEIVLPLIERCSGEFEGIHFVLAGYGILEDELRRWVRERPGLPVTIMGRIPYRDAGSFTGSLDLSLVSTNPGSDFARSICPVKVFDSLAMGVDVLVTRTDATEFLRGLSPSVHLCDFTVDSFHSEMKPVYSEKRRRKGVRSLYTGISHQSVSMQIRELIDAHAG